MKAILSIVLLLLAVTDSPSETGVPAVNSQPIGMKGTNGGASRAVRVARPLSRGNHDARMDALRQFKTIQNADGSWAENEVRQLSTAFALISFLRCGESDDSPEFGKTMKKAQNWLLSSKPQTDSERIATAVALSDWVTVHYRWHHKQAMIPSTQIRKIKECVDGVSPRCSEIWKDLLAVSRLPDEVVRKQDDATVRTPTEKYLDREFPAVLLSIDDYVLLFLCTHAHFSHGGRKWEVWEPNLRPMYRFQRANSFFPCKAEADRIAVTGSCIMSLAVYYITSSHFFANFAD